jgi:hypothetical protein
MDLQTAFNVAMSLAAFMGGYILNRITSSLDKLDDDVRSMPMKYVAKDDYRRYIDHLTDICQQIFNKLDGKVDK